MTNFAPALLTRFETSPHGVDDTFHDAQPNPIPFTPLLKKG